jgi:NADH-quinone oxidoreductase subunit N
LTAAYLWIFLPILLGIFFFTASRRTMYRWGTLSALGLAILAWLVPLDTPFHFAGLNLKVSSSFDFLGRSLSFDKQAVYILILLYGITAMWFYGVHLLQKTEVLIPWGFLFNGLLLTLLTVRPFLYAAIVLEALGFLLLFLLRPPSPGILRFLAHQTLAFPFLLLAASFGSEPRIMSDAARAPFVIALLGVGLALSAGLFPFHSWMPLLGAELHPYFASFLLWLLPLSTLLFAGNILERFSLYTSLISLFQISGLLMILIGSGEMLVERHWGRALGYAAMIETGYGLLSLSLSQNGHSILLASLFPRSLNFVLWGFSLSILYQRGHGLEQRTLEGLGRRLPFAATSLILAIFSTAGFPLLASFPWRVILWNESSTYSLLWGLLFLISLAGIFGHALRTFNVLFAMESGANDWKQEENLDEKILLSLGVLFLVISGLFPQILMRFL